MMRIDATLLGPRKLSVLGADSVPLELQFVSLVGWASWESVVGGTGATSLGPRELSETGADSARVELGFSLVGWASCVGSLLLARG